MGEAAVVNEPRDAESYFGVVDTKAIMIHKTKQVVYLPAVKSYMADASGADAVALLARYEKRFPHTRTLRIAMSYDDDNNATTAEVLNMQS